MVAGRMGTTPEERRLFRQRQIGWMARCRAEAECVLQTDVVEAAIWYRITTAYVEAPWIEYVHQFPDGRPLIEQDPLDLELWQLAQGALNRSAANGRDL